jgi:hypothetical protein
MAREKVLWVVNYNKLDEFVRQASDIGATGVAIRSDNNLSQAIAKFHAKGIKVFGWRWPSAHRDPCLNEAAKIANLLGKGLDGYFVDPEGEKGKPYDWDLPGLEGLAEDFCRTITSAAPNKPFGVSSHYRAKKYSQGCPGRRFSSLRRSYCRRPIGELARAQSVMAFQATIIVSPWIFGRRPAATVRKLFRWRVNWLL